MLQTLGGLWELMRLAAKTRFRLRGKYWRWRMETAFGSDHSKLPPARARRKATLEYARWVRRMRREMN
jgi:hypothetical protein